MKILLIYPPFATPASPPYSITNLYAFLKNNLDKSHAIKAIDLNIEFHKIKFQEYQKEFQEKYERGYYEKIGKEFRELSKEVYSKSNKEVVLGKNPELFDKIIEEILKEKPDVVGLSIIYSSQAFYAHALIKELKKKKIKVVIGGSAVNEKLISSADSYLKNEIELLEYINEEKRDYKKLNCRTILDFSIYPLNEYFTPKIVLPIKTSNTCYYQKCAFCHHHTKEKYEEFPLENIAETIKKSGQKYFFVIDDMIYKKRLLDIAKIMKENNVKWMCQLKPGKELDFDTLMKLKESGLNSIMWGVESGNGRILDLMRKQTNKSDIKKALENSKEAGIKNAVFIMFGFPTETKEELMETVLFLKDNERNIDLVLTSIFGLQEGTEIYKNPKKFGIKKIIESERTILESRISYEVETGLSQKEAEILRKKHKKEIEKINKYPKTMNFFREHMLIAE